MQKKLSRWKFGAALAATFLCLVGAPALASAASSSDDAGLQAVERMMQSIDMEAAFKDSLGLSSPEKNRIMAQAFKAILVDRDFIRYFCKQGGEIGLWDTDPATSGNELGKFVRTLTHSLALKGFARLSAADQRAVVHYNRLMVENAMNGRVCRASQLFTGEATSEEIRLSGRHLLNKISIQDLNAYLRAYKRAVLAEVRQDPPVRGATRAQAELAERALGRAFDKAMNGLSDQELERLIPAFQDMEGVPAEDACSALRLTFRVYDGLSGDVGDWARADFFRSDLGAY